MKIKSLLIVAFLFLTLLSHAQECNEGLLAQKPGTWKEGMKGSVTGIAASDLSKEKAVLASIHTMIKANYSPKSLAADYSYSFSRPYPEMPANSYSYNILFLPFYCEGNTMKTAHETSTSFQIGVNQFDAEIFESYGSDTSEGKGFHSMDDMPVEKDGCYFFKEKNANLGFGVNGKSSMWLITHDGQLPYAYVSKKTFLEKRKQLLARDMPVALASLRENLKSIEVQKTQVEQEYKSDPEKLKRYLKNTYLSNKERFEKEIIKTELDFKNAFAGIETMLKMTPSELGQPAIVKQDPHDYLSYLFTSDDDPFGRVLIQPNPGYFNKKLPRSSPQFITIQVIAEMSNKISAGAVTDVVKAVDFAALKNMLGK